MYRRPFLLSAEQEKSAPRGALLKGTGPWGQIEPDTRQRRGGGAVPFRAKEKRRSDGQAFRGAGPWGTKAGVAVKAQHAGTAPPQTISRLKPRGQIT